jgi:hypothetical protein
LLNPVGPHQRENVFHGRRDFTRCAECGHGFSQAVIDSALGNTELFFVMLLAASEIVAEGIERRESVVTSFRNQER